MFCNIGNNTATIVGLVFGIVGGILLLSIVVFIIYYYIKRRRRTSGSADFVSRRDTQGRGYEPLQLELAKKKSKTKRVALTG